MASAEIVVDALKDVRNKPELDRYDEKLCLDIQQKLDATLKEKNMSISEKSIFVSSDVRLRVWQKICSLIFTKFRHFFLRAETIWSSWTSGRAFSHQEWPCAWRSTSTRRLCGRHDLIPVSPIRTRPRSALSTLSTTSAARSWRAKTSRTAITLSRSATPFAPTSGSRSTRSSWRTTLFQLISKW